VRPLAFACLGLGVVWLVQAALTIGVRAVSDRRRARARPLPARGTLRERRLLARATSHRTRFGRGRRVSALRALCRAGHPDAPALIRQSLADRDAEIVGAAIRALGELGDEWAAEMLVEALRNDACPRSWIAAQLERMAPAIAHLLVPLLDDPQAPVRFWAATLLARYPGLPVDELVARTRDPDANVRAAAVETLGALGRAEALPAALALLGDPAWFVRVHACRAAGALGTPAVAGRVALLLADEWWWVRSAAKDALRGFGRDIVSLVVPYLENTDRFARNGAAEVLQDVGFVDRLVARDPEGELLARIYAAGGPRLRAAAEGRAVASRLAA
jgi:HEAT repeat protein